MDTMKPSRRQFLGGAAALLVTGGRLGEIASVDAQSTAAPTPARDLLLVNGQIHTMDATTASSRRR